MSDHTLDSIEPGTYADALPDMDADEYERVKRSIEQHGFDESDPIRVTPDGTIVDGHHRYRACHELDATPTIREVEGADMDYAIRTNLARRDHGSGEKRAVVERWLESERYDEDMSQRDVADALGVGTMTVNRAMDSVFDDPEPDAADDADGESVPAGTPDGGDPENGDAHSFNKDEASGERESDDTDDADDMSEAGDDDGHVRKHAPDVTVDTDGDDESDSPESPPDDEPDAEPTNNTTREVAEMYVEDKYGTTLKELATDTTPDHDDDDPVRELENRVDELESQIREMRTAFENQDIERLGRLMDSAGEML